MEEIETGSESTESGVSEGSSPEASGSSSGGGESAQAAAPKPQQDQTPFHEHPRFKELVEQKNESLRRYQDMESRYKTLEQQLSSLKEAQPKTPTETDQLIADLKKVDPRLANVIEQQLKAAETAKSVQARLEQFERQSQESRQQQVLQNAVGKINSLHESNKMNDFGKQFINNQLDIAYRSGKLDASNLAAVEAAYRQCAEVVNKAFEDAKREVTKSYVQEKSKDSSVPASLPKGAQGRPAAKPLNVPRDKEALKAAVVKSFLKEQSAAKDATNT